MALSCTMQCYGFFTVSLFVARELGITILKLYYEGEGLKNLPATLSFVHCCLTSWGECYYLYRAMTFKLTAASLNSLRQ